MFLRSHTHLFIKGEYRTKIIILPLKGMRWSSLTSFQKDAFLAVLGVDVTIVNPVIYPIQ